MTQLVCQYWFSISSSFCAGVWKLLMGMIDLKRIMAQHSVVSSAASRAPFRL